MIGGIVKNDDFDKDDPVHCTNLPWRDGMSWTPITITWKNGCVFVKMDDWIEFNFSDAFPILASPTRKQPSRKVKRQCYPYPMNRNGFLLCRIFIKENNTTLPWRDGVNFAQMIVKWTRRRVFVTIDDCDNGPKWIEFDFEDMSPKNFCSEMHYVNCKNASVEK